MRKAVALLIAFLLMIQFFTDCTPTDRYERRLKQELASGVRNDSLFMGLYLGMPQKDFYTHCWNLNKQGLIRQGSSNTTVEYRINRELKYPARMDFYPRFYDGKIFEMPVRFVYNGWAPWNRELTAEKLQDDVLNWFEKTYGKGFIEVVHPSKSKAFIKIDGNRRISLFTEDDLYVWAIFTDMFVNADSIPPAADTLNLVN